MDKLKIGIIGSGGIAQSRHIPTLQQLEDKVSIEGVYDINQDRAQEVAAAFSIARVYHNIERMLEEVDAVVICTPNKFHADIAVQALDRGIHVLCEKPMAITTEECERMIEAAEKTDSVLAIAFHYRFGPEAQIAKQMMENHEIGDPLVCRFQALRRRKVPGWGVFTNKELQGGGSLIDYGCHLLDLSLWLLGNPKPLEVMAKTYDRLSKAPNLTNEWGQFDQNTFNVEDHVTGYITFENDITMQLECSWAANIKEDTEQLSISGVEGGLQLFPFELYQSKYGTLLNSTAQINKIDNIEPYYQANNFVDSCTGEAELIVKPEQAMKVTKIVEALYESSETGKSVRFEENPTTFEESY